MMNSEGRFDAEVHGLNPGSVEPHLGNFLAELSASGYTRLPIVGYAMSVAHFADWLRRKGLSVEVADEKVLARFAVHHCRCFGIRAKRRLSGSYLKRVRRFMRYLSARGVVTCITTDEPPKSPIPHLLEFRDWIHRHRGLAAQTVGRYEHHLAKLLPALGRDIASQLPVEAWHAYLGEPTLADAILDRLVHQSHRIELKVPGESMRKSRVTVDA